jgi:hypothetical protein
MEAAEKLVRKISNTGTIKRFPDFMSLPTFSFLRISARRTKEKAAGKAANAVHRATFQSGSNKNPNSIIID